MIGAECSWPTEGSGVRGHADDAVVVENVDMRAALRVQRHGAHSARPGHDVQPSPVCCVKGAVAFDDRTAGLGRVGSAARCQRQGVSWSNAVRTRSWTGSSAVIS